MGLDMYLTKETYLFDRDGNEQMFSALKGLGIDPEKVKAIREEAMYWRKANAIHKWFVDNVQRGVDDCGQYEVSLEQLKTLHEQVKRVLEKRILGPELLPTQEGFFFGTQDYDDWYWDDMESTDKALDVIIEQGEKLQDRKGIWVSYYYQSSW